MKYKKNENALKIVILDHPRENPDEISWEGCESFGDVMR